MDIPYIIFIIILIFLVILLFYYMYYVQPHNSKYKSKNNNELEHIDNCSNVVDMFKIVKDEYGHYPALQTESNIVFTSNKIKSSNLNTINYSDYWNESEVFCTKVIQFIGQYSRVAILSKNRPEWFIVHMGTIMSGGISIGIYPTASESNIKYIINDSDADLIIVEDKSQMKKLQNMSMDNVKLILQFDDISDDNPETRSIMNNVQRKNSNLSIMSYSEFMEFPNDKLRDPINIHPSTICSIIYTSGTTGNPKGVVLKHKAIMHSIKNCFNSLRTRSNTEIDIGESFISYLPLNHIAAQLMDIYVPIGVGGLVHCARPDALKGSLRESLKICKPTVFIGVPRVWQKLKEGIQKKLSGDRITDKIKRYMMRGNIIKMFIGLDKVKYCLSAAAPLDIDTKQFFENIGIEICNVYGMSETAGPISISVPGMSDGCGVPVMDIKIDNDTKEIMVKGNNLFSEYYGKGKMDSFKKKWFKTGDTGYIDRNGSLYITGRIKDIIITHGGENISPIPIEQTIKSELENLKYDIDNVVLIGNNRKYLTALIFSLDIDSDDIEIINNDIENVIQNVNENAPNPSSTVKKFCIINHELEVGKCLTPTLKLRRHNILEVYKNEIDELYN